MSALQVKTGADVTELTVTCPLLSLDATEATTGTKVVSNISKTYIYSPDGKYIQLIYTFELLAALLDSAPTNIGGGSGSTNIFQMKIQLEGTAVADSYIVDAMIQTKGNSALSPTYSTKVSGGYIYFPVTNFFTVSSPGAPYTITITMTAKI